MYFHNTEPAAKIQFTKNCGQGENLWRAICAQGLDQPRVALFDNGGDHPRKIYFASPVDMYGTVEYRSGLRWLKATFPLSGIIVEPAKKNWNCQAWLKHFPHSAEDCDAITVLLRPSESIGLGCMKEAAWFAARPGTKMIIALASRGYISAKFSGALVSMSHPTLKFAARWITATKFEASKAAITIGLAA